MSIISRIEENITGAGKTILRRFFYLIFLILSLFFLDYFAGFPLGFIQLNQLEQLEKIDILLSSKTLDSSAKNQFKIEQAEIAAHYKFLSDLRFSLRREFISNINRQETLAMIDVTAKKTKTSIPNFFCSDYAYTISLTFLWFFAILYTLYNLSESDTVGQDLLFSFLVAIPIAIIYLIIGFIPRSNTCLKTHLIYILINIIITTMLVIYMSMNNPEESP